MPLTAGTQLGPYEIVEAIGSGGMGAVYKARDTRLGREVAVKVLPSDKMSDPDRKRRFIQEARAASALNHPQIVTIHDIGETAGIDYIVMEYVDGRTLDHLIPRDGMKPADALKFAIPIADAMARAHAAGIVHRDLKPANVIVSRDGVVKVLDFGLAKLTSPAPAADGATRTMGDASAAGIIVGTAAYMSPEQAEGELVDARSDIFSFGAMLYEMLTGRRAFQGKTTVSTMAAVLHDDPKPARELAPEVPAELERIVRRTLRKNPDQRFQDAADLKVALMEMQEDLQSGKLEKGVPAVTRKRAVWPIGLVAAVALLVGVAGASWLLRNSFREPPVYTFRRLTNDSGLTHNPALSPDGKLVAYESDRGGGGATDIWLQQVAGGNPIRLTNCKANCMQPSFSPDGASVVYYSAEKGGGIYLVPSLGGEARRIVDVAAYMGAMPRFSPDGSKLAYRSYDFPRMNLYVTDIHGGSPRRLDSSGVHPVPNDSLVWSSDGRGIFTWTFSEPETWALYVFPADGGSPLKIGDTRLVSGARRRIRPSAWIGDRLLLDVWDGSRNNLAETTVSSRSWKMGTELRNITQGSGSEFGASPSADGSRLAFAAYTESNSGVWRVPMDVAAGKPTGAPAQVTQPFRFIHTPSPAARAPAIAYVANEDRLPSVWLRDLGSGRERRLGDRSSWPVMSGDGRKIAFRQVRGRFDIAPGPLFIATAESESVRKVCDVCGTPYQFFAGDSKLLFDHASGSHEIQALDLASGKTSLVLRHAKNQIYTPHLSPDEKWISFLMALGAQRRFYVAPFHGEQEIRESEWMLALSGDTLDRQPFWAPVGDLLYFMSDRDGFRCIWALRLDAQTRKASGEPFAVQHFHDIRYTMNPFANPASVGLSVSQDAMYLSLYEERANVWLAEQVGQR